MHSSNIFSIESHAHFSRLVDSAINSQNVAQIVVIWHWSGELAWKSGYTASMFTLFRKITRRSKEKQFHQNSISVSRSL